MKTSLVAVKMILIIMIVVSIGSILGAIGYIASIKNSLPVAVQQSPKLSVTPTVSSDINVSDWQIYGNEEYGYEIKFPSNLVLQKNTGETYISFSGKLEGKSYFLNFGYVSQSALNAMGISYCGAHLEDSRCENFAFDDLQFLIDWNIETEGAFTQSRAEISKPEGGMIVISILHSPGQDIKLLFRQILSTFKFTEKNNESIISPTAVPGISKDNSDWKQFPVSINPVIVSQFEGKIPAGLERIPVIKNGDLYTVNKNGEVLKRLTNHKGVQSFLASPNGAYIAYIHAKGTISHPGAAMNFIGTLNLKIVDTISGTESRNIFLENFELSPFLEYFWDRNNNYVYIYFFLTQGYNSNEGLTEKQFWIRYDAKTNKNKFLTEQEFNAQKKLAIISITGSADLTYHVYPAVEDKKEILAPLFRDLYDKISPVAKNTLLERYRERTIHPADDSPSYNYSSGLKEAFVSMSNIIFSPNLKKAAVYLDTSRCENMDYMITYSTPVFIIDLATGEITEISEPYRFLSLVWTDDENFLISDRIVYEVSLDRQKYTIKRFLEQDKNFISTCEMQSGPSITLPCDGLGEALGPVEILTDPCSA